MRVPPFAFPCTDWAEAVSGRYGGATPTSHSDRNPYKTLLGLPDRKVSGPLFFPLLLAPLSCRRLQLGTWQCYRNNMHIVTVLCDKSLYPLIAAGGSDVLCLQTIERNLHYRPDLWPRFCRRVPSG